MEAPMLTNIAPTPTPTTFAVMATRDGSGHLCFAQAYAKHNGCVAQFTTFEEADEWATMLNDKTKLVPSISYLALPYRP
jgi:hypothetical protein